MEADMRRTRVFLLSSLMLILWLTPFPVSAQGNDAGVGGRGAFFGQDFTLAEGEQWEGELVLFGGRLDLQRGSVVEGDVAVMGGEAQVAGTIEGDLVAFGGSLELGESAVIEGDVVVLGQLRRHPDSTIEGNLVEGLEAGKGLKYLPPVVNGRPGVGLVRPQPPTAPFDAPRWILGLLRAFAAMIAILTVAVIGILLLPDNLQRITRVMTASTALSFGVGLLTILLTAILIPLLTIICIGIPVAVVLGVALMLCAMVGWISAGRLVGERVVRVLNISTQSPVVEMLAGTILITLLGMIRCVGPLFTAVVLSWGIGAVVLTRFGAMAYPSPTTATGERPSGTSSPDAGAPSQSESGGALPIGDDSMPLEEATDVEPPQ